MTLVEVGILFSIGAAVFNVIAFMIIKFNDFSHLEKYMKQLDVTMEKHTSTIVAHGERISRIEGAFGVCVKKEFKRKK